MGRSHGLGAPRHGIVFPQPAQRNVGTDLRAPEDWNTVSITRLDLGLRVGRVLALPSEFDEARRAEELATVIAAKETADYTAD